IKGLFVLTPQGKQPFELKALSVTLAAASEPDYPLQKKRHTLEYLREISHLRPRSNTFSAVFRTRSVLAFAIHKYFNEKGFIYVNTPIITCSDAEGAGEAFKVTTLDYNKLPYDERNKIDYTKDFFGKESFLTVSGQLQAEAFALAFKKVYTFGPTFRAENSNTARHATEFWMVEPEVAFNGISDNMDLAEDFIKYLISYVLTNCRAEMEFFDNFIDKDLIARLEHIVKSDFERITYTKAVELLEKSGKTFAYPIKWGLDLQTEHERYLTEEIYKKPVFVVDYPKDVKAFYMRLNDDNKTVAAMDLLVPGVGEIIGGSQREERADKLTQAMDKIGINKDNMQWYISLRCYGGCVHSGFGLGFERLLMYITGMKNIRDVLPFARTVNNADF
ncbi:MAG: asparagine--tRNA ligase, partial [Eubacteriaceae bacterium]|nr:asparagine--tRNA ligase [Eubacteriaceae bacterium]